MSAETVACPWCAEEILAAAKKCKHCGEFLTEERPTPGTLSPATPSASPTEEVELTATAKPHRCERCFAPFASARELYLHRVNVHNEITATPGPLAAAARTGAKRPPAGRGPSSKIVCPHCQTAGHVTTRKVKLKKGISGGKAAGAVLTAGFSIFATGLSRKEAVTEARCGNCRAVWHF